jgi:hypothetical protein
MLPRTSIAGLLALMIPIAVGLAALTDPSPFWSGAVLVLTLTMLFSSIVGAIYRRGGRRASWLGFAVFGWGYCALLSQLTIDVRPFNQAPRRAFAWNAEDGEEGSIRETVRGLLDYLRLNRRTAPGSVGEKVEVLWGSSYYGASISSINGNQYKIRYDNDPQGNFDEWVGLARIKLADEERYHRIGELLLALLFALAGAIISRYFYATSRPDEPTRDRPQGARS